MKKFFTFMMCLFVLITLIGCGDQGEGQEISCYGNMLPEEITTLVRAKCTGEDTYLNNIRYVKFKTVQNLYGETEEFFWIETFSFPTQYAHQNHNYETDKEYLIIAQKHISVYMPFDKFTSWSQYSFMPIDVIGYNVGLLVDRYISLDTAIPILYNDFDATDPSNAEMATNEEVYQRFTKLVVDYLNSDPSRPQFYGNDYTRSDDWEKVTEQAAHIVVLKADKRLGEGSYEGTEKMECTVKEIKKGDDVGEKIQITFFEGTVEKGGKYLVCLAENGGGSYYELSAKNAVKTVREPLPTAVIIIVSSVAVAVIVALAIILALKFRRAGAGIKDMAKEE